MAFARQARLRARNGALLGVLTATICFSAWPAHTALATPLGAVSAPAPASNSRARRAAERYELGAAEFHRSNYRAAVAHFLAADELAPSAALSYNIALSYDKLSDTPRALSFYRDYLARERRGANSELVAERIRELELDLMRRGVQQLTVRSAPTGATLTLQGRPVGVTPWTGELQPGEYQLALTLPDGSEGRRRVLLPAANAVDVTIPLQRAETPAAELGSPSRPSTPTPTPDPDDATDARADSKLGVWPWVSLGAGATALAAAGTFELLRRQADSEATTALNPQQYKDRREQVSDYRRASLVAVGTGGVFLIASGILFALDEPVEKTQTAIGCTHLGCFGSYATRF